MKTLRATVVLPMLLASSLAAEASLLTFEYTGTVSTYTIDATAALQAAYTIGTAARFRFTFDDTVADSGALATQGLYVSLTHVEAAIGGVTISGNAGSVPPTGRRIVVLDNQFLGASFPNVDRYQIQSSSSIFTPVTDGATGFTLFGSSMTLDDHSGTAFSSDALPLAPPAPSSFPNSSFFRFEFRDSLDAFAGAVLVRPTATVLVSSTGASPAPEPGTLALLALGLAAFARRGHARRR